MAPAPGVSRLHSTPNSKARVLSDFVYRSLDNTSIEVLSGTSDRVVNEATQMAHLHSIAPGKRVRGNIEKWAASTISLRGGQTRELVGSSRRR